MPKYNPSQQAVNTYAQTIDAAGNAINSAAGQVAAYPPYQQSSNAALANPNGASTPNTGIPGGGYIWDAQFTGTSLVLESLGADAVTWRTVATLNASGTFAGTIDVGNNAAIRVRAPTGATGVYSSLAKART